MHCFLFSLFNFALVFISLGKTASPCDQKLEWVHVKQSEILLSNPQPAGVENGHYFFLCRIEHEGRHYSGKLRFNTDSILCLVGIDGVQYANGTFQILETPPGVTSWVPLRGSIPSTAVVTDIWEGDVSYVCRAKFHDPVFIIPGTLTDNGACSFELSHVEEVVTNHEDIEVLAINKFGQARGIVQTFDFRKGGNSTNF